MEYINLPDYKALATLKAVVRHHLDPIAALRGYDPSQAILPALPGARDFTILSDRQELDAIARANELAPVTLSDVELREVLAFLDSLTDPVSTRGRLGVPQSVPSGLSVDR